MIDLLEYLVEQFVGRAYVPLIRCLMEGEKTLLELVQKELASYDTLTDMLKYLIRQDIVTLNKHGDRLTYCTVPEAVLYFQRSVRYNRYILQTLSKEEASIVQYLLKNRSSLLDHTVKAVSSKKSGTRLKLLQSNSAIRKPSPI